MNIIDLDQQLFLYINGLVGQSTFFDAVARSTVNEYFVPTLISLFLLGMWFYWDSSKEKDKNQKSVVVSVFAVALASLVVVSLLNYFFDRPRPFEILDINLLFYKPTDPSFPSNSTVVAFSLATSVFLANKRIGIITLLLASFYGFVRIFVGVHFPLDVLTGAVIGIGAVFIINAFHFYLNRVVGIIRRILKIINLEEFA